jgi:hypothetical protein
VQVSTICTDAIEEINIITNGYQAETAATPARRSSIVSKSGTRNFRGGYRGSCATST